jgi:hypothetical protein
VSTIWALGSRSDDHLLGCSSGRERDVSRNAVYL